MRKAVATVIAVMSGATTAPADDPPVESYRAQTVAADAGSVLGLGVDGLHRGDDHVLAVAGAVVASVIDVVRLAGRSGPEPRPGNVLTPTASIVRGGATVGLGGSF